MTFGPEAGDRRPADATAEPAENGLMQEPDQPTSSPIRVVIGSNDSQLRGLLGTLLSADDRFDVVALSPNGDNVVSEPATFDVAVLDLSIAGLGILGVISHLKRRDPSTPVVVITQHDAVYLRHALEAEGAADYMVIPGSLPEVADRIARVHEAAHALMVAG